MEVKHTKIVTNLGGVPKKNEASLGWICCALPGKSQYCRHLQAKQAQSRVGPW
jgi:hypothetical protein